jgi:hypothetical protein
VRLQPRPRRPGEAHRRQATDGDQAADPATRALNRGDTGRGQHLRNAIRSRRCRGRRAGDRRGRRGRRRGARRAAQPDRRLRAVLARPGVRHRAESARGEVPSQKGRVIRGYFFGRGFSGTPEPAARAVPRPRVGPHPIFVVARAARRRSARSASRRRGVGKGRQGRRLRHDQRRAPRPALHPRRRERGPHELAARDPRDRVPGAARSARRRRPRPLTRRATGGEPATAVVD